MKVAAVNPSKEKSYTVEVKSYLPEEISAKDVISTDGLELKYDQEKSRYYVYKKEVALSPNETKVFRIELRHVWYISPTEINNLKLQAETILNEKKGNKIVEEIASTIFNELKTVSSSQAEAEGLGVEEEIATYRKNLQILAKVKEEIERMKMVKEGAGEGKEKEKVPEEATEENLIPQTQTAPTKGTTWMVIFIIMSFIGILGGTFFFAWVRSSRALEKSTLEASRATFPEFETPSTEKK